MINRPQERLYELKIKNKRRNKNIMSLKAVKLYDRKLLFYFKSYNTRLLLIFEV